MNINYVKLFLVQIMWAGTFVASEIALTNVSPLFLATIRFILTLLIFFAFLYKKCDFSRIVKKDYIYLFLMGFFGIFAYTMLLHYGLVLSNSSYAALIIPVVQPIFTTVITIIVLKEFLNLNSKMSIAVGFIGSSLIISSNLLISDIETFTGTVLIMLSALTFSIYSVISRFLSNNISSSEITLISTFFGTLVLTILFLVTEGETIKNIEIDSNLIWSLGYLVVFATVLPYIWWNQAIKEIGSISTGNFTLLMPPLALLFSYILLDHSVSLIQLAGGLISFIGLVLLLRGKSEKK